MSFGSRETKSQGGVKMVFHREQLKPLLCLITCISLFTSTACMGSGNRGLGGILDRIAGKPGKPAKHKRNIEKLIQGFGDDKEEKETLRIFTRIGFDLVQHTIESRRRRATQEERRKAREQAARRPQAEELREAIRNKKVNLKYAEIIDETQNEYLVIIIDPDTNRPVDNNVYIIPKREFDKLKTVEADRSPKNADGERTIYGVTIPPSKEGREAPQAGDKTPMGTGEVEHSPKSTEGSQVPKGTGQRVPPIGPSDPVPGEAGPQPGATTPRENETVPSVGSGQSAGESQSGGGDPGQQEPGGQKGQEAGAEVKGATGKAGSGNQAASGSGANQAGNAGPPNLGGKTGSEPGAGSLETAGQPGNSDPAAARSNTSQPEPASQSGTDVPVGASGGANAQGGSSEEPERRKFGKLGAHNVIFRL